MGRPSGRRRPKSLNGKPAGGGRGDRALPSHGRGPYSAHHSIGRATSSQLQTRRTHATSFISVSAYKKRASIAVVRLVLISLTESVVRDTVHGRLQSHKVIYAIQQTDISRPPARCIRSRDGWSCSQDLSRQATRPIFHPSSPWHAPKRCETLCNSCNYS
jgi:hypothetical protein